jgi:hypothetical protein
MRDHIQIMIEIIAERVKKESQKAMNLGLISEDQCNREMERIGKLEGQIVKKAQKLKLRKRTRKTRPRGKGH